MELIVLNKKFNKDFKKCFKNSCVYEDNRNRKKKARVGEEEETIIQRNMLSMKERKRTKNKNNVVNEK